jgi:hypothetical protein
MHADACLLGYDFVAEFAFILKKKYHPFHFPSLWFDSASRSWKCFIPVLIRVVVVSEKDWI